MKGTRTDQISRQQTCTIRVEGDVNQENIPSNMLLIVAGSLVH